MARRATRVHHVARWSLTAALVASALAGLPACGKEEPKTALTYTQDAKLAYEAALEEFTAHNWIESQNLMREVKRKYSYSRYAKLAELRIADAEFEQEKYAEAIRAYRQFVHDHRSDPDEVSYARSRIAEAEFRQIQDSIFLPSGDERDQASVMEAYRELRAYLHDYPAAKEAPRMRELLTEVTARLVRHELYVARFYLDRDNYDAAISRVHYALRNFTATRLSTMSTGGEAGKRKTASIEGTIDSGLEAEALLLLGETYLRMRKYDAAREAFQAILAEYPKSGISEQATRYLGYMKQNGV